MKSGETRVTVKLHGPLADADVEVLVDTGATFTKVPRSVAKNVGAGRGGSWRFRWPMDASWNGRPPRSQR